MKRTIGIVVITDGKRNELLSVTLKTLRPNMPDDAFLLLVSIAQMDKPVGCDELILATSNLESESALYLGAKYVIARCNPDIVLLSADDYDYKAGWSKRLARFLFNCDPRVSLVTLNMEPEWPWNKKLEQHNVLNVPSWIRRSAPGANWAFKTTSWKDHIEQMFDASLCSHNASEVNVDHGVCDAIFNSGHLICAIDECVHTGSTCSTQGNLPYGGCDK